MRRVENLYIHRHLAQSWTAKNDVEDGSLAVLHPPGNTSLLHVGPADDEKPPGQCIPHRTVPSDGASSQWADERIMPSIKGCLPGCSTADRRGCDQA